MKITTGCTWQMLGVKDMYCVSNKGIVGRRPSHTHTKKVFVSDLAEKELKTFFAVAVQTG